MVFNFLNIFNTENNVIKYELKDSIKTGINIIDTQHLAYFIFSKKLEDKINSWNYTKQELDKYMNFIIKYLEIHFECE